MNEISKNQEQTIRGNAKFKNFLTDYVILCSGVIGTNSLFLGKHAGDIDDNYLREHNVGLSVKDHSNVRVNVRSSKSFGSLNELNETVSKKVLYFSPAFLGLNTLRGTGATSGVHLDLDGDGVVDTRIHLLQFSETGRHKSDDKDFCSGPGFSLSISPIKTMSFGENST